MDNNYNTEKNSPLYYGNNDIQNRLGTKYIPDTIKSMTPVKAKIYMNFPESNEFKNKIFEGLIESANTDHIIVSKPNGISYLLPLIYLNFIEFDENIRNDLNLN